MSNNVEKLTQDEIAHCEIVRDRFISHALESNHLPLNKEACEKYIKLVYSLDEDYNEQKVKNLKFVYVNSPLELQEYVNLYFSSITLKKEIRDDNVFDKETIEYAKKNSKYYSLSYYTSLSNYTWIAFFKYFEEIGILKDDFFKEYSDLFVKANIYEWAKFEDRAIIVRKPKYIKKDEQGRLHCNDGACLEWLNGDKHYFVKGIEVPESWIENKVTLDNIQECDNAELRRIAMELYGYKEYVLDTGAKQIAKDEYGELYYLEVLDDEPIVMVSVLNSACEPYEQMGLEQREEFRNTEIAKRGEWYKRYMLRVPPDTKTPLDGLAWSHNVTPEEYKNNLIFET